MAKKYLLKMKELLAIKWIALVAIMISGLMVSDGVRAEMIIEKNKILLGDDYSIFSLKRGERKRCRTACEKDRRCQSWTFVRPQGDGLGQCRLKRSLAPGFGNSCCVSGYKKNDYRENHGNKRRGKKVAICDEWAAEAVEIAQENRRQACGYRGQAWHLDENRYFRRCMQIGPKARASERRGQQKAIDACVAELGYGKQARCDHYARVANEQNRSRKANACGIKNPSRWKTNYKLHYNWCLKANKKETFAEEAARNKRLQRCYAFEEQKSGPCHEYAQVAIAHFRKNVAKGCDLHGDQWHNNYRRHVSWCRKAGSKQRSRANNKRRLTLKTCRLFGKIGIQWR